MAFLAKSKLIWFLSLCILNEARNLHKQNMKLEAVRTPQIHTMEQERTGTKVSDISVATLYDGGNFSEENVGIEVRARGKTKDLKTGMLRTTKEYEGQLIHCDKEKEAEHIPGYKTVDSDKEKTSLTSSRFTEKETIKIPGGNLGRQKRKKNQVKLELKMDSDSFTKLKLIESEDKEIISTAFETITPNEDKQEETLSSVNKTSSTDISLETTDNSILMNVNNLQDKQNKTENLVNLMSKEETILKVQENVNQLNTKGIENNTLVNPQREENSAAINLATEVNKTQHSTSVPFFEKLTELPGHIGNENQTDTEQHIQKEPIENDKEKLHLNVNKPPKTTPAALSNFSTIDTIIFEPVLNTTKDSQIKHNITGTILETQGNQTGLTNVHNNFTNNLFKPLTNKVITLTNTSSILQQLQLSLAAVGNNKTTARPVPFIGQGPKLPYKVQIKKPSTALNKYQTTRRPTTTSRPSTTPTTTATVTRQPSIYPVWLPNYSALPTPPLLSNYFTNPFNKTFPTINPAQNPYGLGIFSIPPTWKPDFMDFFVPNYIIETPPTLSDAISTPAESRDLAFWNALFHRRKIIKLMDAKINRTLLENITSTEDLIKFPKFKHNKTLPATMPPKVHVLHLFLPLKYVLQRPNLTDILTVRSGAVAKDRKIALDIKDPVKSDEIRSPNNSKSDEKSSLMFELELPKPIVQFVKGVVDIFTPFMQN